MTHTRQRQIPLTDLDATVVHLSVRAETARIAHFALEEEVESFKCDARMRCRRKSAGEESSSVMSANSLGLGKPCGGKV